MQFTHTDYNSLNTVHCAAMLVQRVYYCYKMLFILKIGIDNQMVSLRHFVLLLV